MSLFQNLILMGQNSKFLDKLSKKNTDFLTDYTGDRLYLQTDKSLYKPGETIWFSGYLRNESDLKASSNSGIIHVELISPQQSTVNHIKLVTKEGKTHGDILLHESLPGGIYTLKAYSNWQMNDTNALIFEKKIQLQKTVLPNLLLNLEFKEKGFGPGDWVTADFKVRTLNDLPLANHKLQYSVMIKGKSIQEAQLETDSIGKIKIKFQLPENLNSADGILNIVIDYRGSKESISRSIPITLNNIKMEFYPEGGDLILNMNSKIAFQCLNEFGKPVDVEGYIIDKDGLKITSFNSFHQGMGYFTLYPIMNDYKAIITKPEGIADVYDLPIPLRVGYNLSVQKVEKDVVHIQVQAERIINVNIVTSVRGEIYHSMQVNVMPGKNYFIIPVKELPVGVAKITLFDNKQVERCERLVYINKHRQLNIKVVTDKKVYAPREKVVATINVSDETGMPMPGSFSMSVVSDKLISFSDDKSGHILSKMLLEADLKGKIEEPNFYFDRNEIKADNALDLLMLTKGWRKFTWKQIINGASIIKKYPSEQTIIAGKLLSGVNSKPIKEHKVFIKETGEFVLTDKNGNFRFTGIDISKNNILSFDGDKEADLIVNEYRNDLIIYTPFGRKGYYSISKSISSAQDKIKTIKGLIRDNENKESLPFANIILFKDGVQVAGTMSDLDGLFIIDNVPDGNYTLKTSYVGYEPISIYGLNKSSEYIPSVTINMQQSLMDIQEFSIIEYQVPLISKDQTSSGGTVTREDIYRLPGRSSSSIAATVGGVNVFEDDSYNIRGSRSPSTDTYIDGIRVRGSANLPMAAIEQVSIIVGGTPAEFEGSRSLNGNYNSVYINTSSSRVNSTNYSSPVDYKTPIYLEQSQVIYYRAKEFPEIKYEPEEVTEIRNDFRSTIYWNPEVVTGRNGNADLVFYNSDEITTFRIIIEGMSDDGMVGRIENTYSVNQLWNLDVKIPPVTLVGDTVILDLRFQNNSDSMMLVEIRPEFPKSWHSISDTLLKFRVDAHGFYNIPLEAVIDLPANDTISFLCIAAGKKEKMMRAVKSSPRGFPFELTFSGAGKLQNEIDFEIRNTLHHSLYANIVIYPNALTDMLQGMESMLREPHGCFEQVSSSTYPNILVLNYLKQQGKESENLIRTAMDKIIKGYNMLAAYEISTGGFDWYGAPPGNEALTAFGIMEFTDMKKVYEGVSDDMIKRSTNWLLKKRDGKGQFNYDAPGRYGYGFANKDVTNSYVVWALSEAGVNGLDKELKYSYEKSIQLNDAYQMSLNTISAVNYNQTQLAEEMIEKLVKKQNEDGSWNGSIHSITRSSGKSLIIETTSLAVLALIRTGSKDRYSLDRGIKYLFENRSGYGSFSSTQATILALKAITEYSSYLKSIAKPGILTVVVNNEKVAETHYSGSETKAIVVSGFEDKLKIGSNKIIISFDSTAKALPYSALVRWNTALPNNSSDVQVKMEAELMKSIVNVGDINRLKVKIKNITNSTLPNTMAIIGIPAGLSVQPWQLKELQEKRIFDYYEIYDNKLVLYFRGMDVEEEINTAFDLKAEIPGIYSSEASCTYLYYNDEHKYWTKSNTVEVVNLK